MSFWSCKESFEPNVIAGNNNYLVVEGYINTGGGETRINLSRTSNLKEVNGYVVETGADVSVEGEDGTVVHSSNQSGGLYSIPTYNLKNSIRYRLRINTKGKEYLSDYLEPTQTPPIDSVSWRKEKNGVQFYVNTHDPLNKTRYYKWDYKETWELRSVFDSFLEYKNGRLVQREPSEYVKTCWAFDKSTQLLLGSSAALTEDRISMNPISFIQPKSEKLAVKYSINLIQYGLSEKGYKYYKNMKKNTQQKGGLFDSQPSELVSNVHSISNSNEIVVGYIMAGTATEKRIYIDRQEILDWDYHHEVCKTDTIPTADASLHTDMSFLYFALPPGNVVIAERICADCSLRGSNIRPDYWPIK